MPTPVLNSKYTEPEPVQQPIQQIQQPVYQSQSQQVPQVQQVPQQSVITLADAQLLADRAAINAVDKIISQIPKTSISDDINLEKEMKKTFYNRMSRPSLGDVIAEQFDSNMAQQFVQKLIPGIFGTGTGNNSSFVKHGIVTDILNSEPMKNFGLGLGQNFGTNIQALIQAFGKEKVDKVVDAYMNKMSPEQQQQQQQSQQSQQISPEEQKKKNDIIMMTIDSTNTSHVTEFMKVANITNYNEAQKVILMEQDRILKERSSGNITTDQNNNQNNNQPIQRIKKPESNDINRQLMRQYEDGNVNSNIINNDRNDNMNQNNLRRDDFFGNGISNQNPFDTSSSSNTNSNVSSNLNNTEFLMSLNPDDLISQQQYMAQRGIIGVPLDIVKKMMLREQKKLTDSRNVIPTGISEQLPIKDVSSIPIEIKDKSIVTGDSWKESDIGKSSIKKDELDIDQIKQEDILIKPFVNKQKLSENDMSPIMNMLQKIGNDMDKHLGIMNKEIEFLKDEIKVLKSKDNHQVHDVNKFYPKNEEYVESKERQEFNQQVNEIYSESEINTHDELVEQLKPYVKEGEFILSHQKNEEKIEDDINTEDNVNTKPVSDIPHQFENINKIQYDEVYVPSKRPKIVIKHKQVKEMTEENINDIWNENDNKL